MPMQASFFEVSVLSCKAPSRPLWRTISVFLMYLFEGLIFKLFLHGNVWQCIIDTLATQRETRKVYRYLFIQNEFHIIRLDLRVEGDSQVKFPSVEATLFT